MATLMRAFDILHQDHEGIRRLFYEYELSNNLEEREQVMRKISSEIRLHAALEEDILYPAAREAVFDADLVDRSLEEHEKIEDLLIEAEACDPKDFRYEEIFIELSETLENHIRNEENVLFPQIEKGGGINFTKLARDLQLRKKNLGQRAA